MVLRHVPPLAGGMQPPWHSAIEKAPLAPPRQSLQLCANNTAVDRFFFDTFFFDSFFFDNCRAWLGGCGGTAIAQHGTAFAGGSGGCIGGGERRCKYSNENFDASRRGFRDDHRVWRVNPIRKVGCRCCTKSLQAFAKIKGMIGDIVEKLEKEQCVTARPAQQSYKVQFDVGVEKMMAFSMTCFA